MAVVKRMYSTVDILNTDTHFFKDERHSAANV